MDDMSLDEFAHNDARDDYIDDETSFTIQSGIDDEASYDTQGGIGDTTAGDETWEVPNETPSWAASSVPSGISQEELADGNQTQAILDRWGRERGEVQQNLEFVSSTKGELWVRWGRKWLLLTNKNRPGVFLKPSTLKRYGVDVTKALGVHESTGLSRQEVAALNRADQELGEVSESVDTVGLQDLGQVIIKVEAAVQTVGMTFTMSEQPGAPPPITQREFLGVCRALETMRGEHTNNVAKLSELDEHLALERRKFDRAPDEGTRNLIAERIRGLEDERAARLEAASSTRKALRSQVNRIRETFYRMLHEDTNLAERIRTLFREQGITIATILTALGMTVSTLVLALTGGSGGGAVPAPTPPQPPAGKGGAKEWIKKHLQSLGRALAKLAGKAAAALPGIIGSIVSWLLSLLGKTAVWMAENLWAVLLAVGGLLLVAAREWLLPKKPKQS